MQLDVRFQGIDRSDALTDFVTDLTHAGFSRFGHLLRQVRVRFTDENGPRGGVDKRCSVELRGAFGTRLIEVDDVDFNSAARRALQKAEAAIARAVALRSN